jgi:hypothetical protein
MRVAPAWNDLTLSTSTTVFVDNRRTEFYDLRVGDTVLASGPHAGDIRFIWESERPPSSTPLMAVALGTGAKGTVTLAEYGGNTLAGYTIEAGSDAVLYSPAERRLSLERTSNTGTG